VEAGHQNLDAPFVMAVLGRPHWPRLLEHFDDNNVPSLTTSTKTVKKYKCVIDAPAPVGPNSTVRLGLTEETVTQLGKYGLKTKIAQLVGIVLKDLKSSQLLFKGLRRPMLEDGNPDADKNVLIYSSKPAFDCYWSGSRQEGEVVQRTPPAGSVFVVLVLLHNTPDETIGSIVQWNWLLESRSMSRSPSEWETRYDEHLWSKNV
jgi:hypothetical protein